MLVLTACRPKSILDLAGSVTPDGPFARASASKLALQRNLSAKAEFRRCKVEVDL